MTTATKTTKKTTKTKKPKWTVITYKKIEQWRTKLGLSKAGMAEALEITNSTYHNWRRGTTVPHATQQEELLVRITALETNASAGGEADSTENKGSSKGKGGRQSGGRSGSTGGGKKGHGGSTGHRSSAPRSGRAHQGVAPPVSLLASENVPRDDVAAITVAFIQSQKKAVTPDSVISFVAALRGVM